jgi:hypothetical protein
MPRLTLIWVFGVSLSCSPISLYLYLVAGSAPSEKHWVESSPTILLARASGGFDVAAPEP